jgi:hypothetical protein
MTPPAKPGLAHGRWLLAALALACAGLAWAVPGWLQTRPGLMEERWVPHARSLLPVALLINAALLGVIALSYRWWTRPWAPAVSTPIPLARCWHRWALLACMIFTVGMNLPRMGISLWGDEEWTLRHNVVGEYRWSAKMGKLKFYPVSWGEAVWDYRTPNNHGFFSLLAKLSHTFLHRPQNTPEALPFSEWTLRVPSLLAALLALALLYQVMRELGQPEAGVVAAALLALHPWFVRYSTEARGYGLLFALWPLAVLMLVRGLRTGRFRWWLGFGLFQGLMLWTWMLALHWVLALNLSALGLLLTRMDDPQRVLPRRWLLGGLAGAMLALPALLPAVPQVRAWMQSGRAAASGPPWAWCGDSACWLLSGDAWKTPLPGSPLCLGRDQDWLVQPLGVALILLIPALLLAAGTAFWVRRSSTHRWLLAAWFLPLVLVVGQALVSRNVLLSWYASPLLPATVTLMAAGLVGLASCLSGRLKFWSAIAGLAVMGGLWWPECSLLRAHDFEPTLTATRLTRSTLNPSLLSDRDPITVQFCMNRPAYDPAAEEPKTENHLLALMEKARASKRDLFVHLGDVPLARVRHPEMMALVDDPRLFESLAILHGMEHAQSRQVWRLRR